MKEFRHDINGLRALAVLAVLMYHLCPSFLPGGFTGVDVFFVVSGFLISKIILDRIEAGTFRFLDFYSRRIRRILPALLCTLLLTLIGGILLFPIDLFAKLGETMFYSSLQISNFFFAKEVGYFEVRNSFSGNPLLHTWSLGVEEQFYLFWPLLLFLTYRHGNKKIPMFIILFFGVLSLLLAEYWLRSGSGLKAFYSPFSRFWEFGLGGLLAFDVLPRFRNTLLYEGISFLGLLMMFISFWLTGSAHFPGITALLPCLGAGLVIVAGTSDTLFIRFSKLRPIALTGLISYSLYLLHYPIIIFYQFYVSQDSVPFPVILVLATVTFAAAYGSWKFVENPFREGTYIPRFFRNPILIIVAILIVGRVGNSTAQEPAWRWRLHNIPPEVVLEVGNRQWDQLIAAGCSLDSAKKRMLTVDFFDEPTQCIFGDTSKKPKVLLFGNSHVYHVIDGVLAFAEEQDSSTYIFETWDMELKEHADPVTTLIQEGIRNLYSQESIEYVFLSYRYVPGEHIFLEQRMHQIAKEVTEMGKTIVFVGQVPHFPFNIHRCIDATRTLIHSKLSEGGIKRCITIAPLQMVSEVQEGHELFRKIACTYPHAYFWDPTPFFCEGDLCAAVHEGKILYRDDPETSSHLNEEGIGYLATFFLRDMRKLFGS